MSKSDKLALHADEKFVFQPPHLRQDSKYLWDIFFKYFLLLVFACLLIWLVYFTPRQSFRQLIALYSLLFVVYFFLLKKIKNAREIIIWGVFFRLLLLFAIPELSDDFYRFVWDGRLLLHHLNPYTILPDDFIQTSDFQRVIGEKIIFEKLNSPHYYTVYPPLKQFIFTISAALSQGNLLGNIVALRIFILFAEVGIITTLTALGRAENTRSETFTFTLNNLKKVSSSGEAAIGTFFFNPLIIIELTGNLHFEGIMICFLLMAFYVGIKSRKSFVWSGFLFACAVCMKILPLIFIPLLIRQIGWKKGLLYTLVVGIFTVLFFLPFFDTLVLEKLFSSINLYFQKFEFNASIYYVVRAAGFEVFGYNIIETAGKIMAFLTFSLVLLISWKSRNLFVAALIILTIYYTMATTVHPWYIANLLIISCFTTFRYPIFWSYTIFFSYAAYQTNLYQENFYLLAAEYLIVFGIIIFETRNHLKRNL